jgi:hypothetical protein
MAYDDPKLPRPVLRGKQLFVGDDKEPYFRDPEALVFLNVTDFWIPGGFERSLVDRDAKTPEPVHNYLRGKAILGEKSRFAVAGKNIGELPIDFTLWPAALELETQFLWRGHIDYSHLWEYSREEMFLVGANVPLDHFHTIIAAVRTGRVERLRIGMQTTMWTKDKASGVVDTRRTWHLVPPTDRVSSDPSHETLSIVSIKWDEICGTKTPPPNDKDAPPPKPAIVDLPTRVYSMLSLITTVLVAILALQFLRR